MTRDQNQASPPSPQRDGDDLVVLSHEGGARERVIGSSPEALAAIVATAADAIVSVDRAQRIVLFNRAAETMFRCSAVEAVGRSVERFFPEGVRAASALRADGEEFPIEATVSTTEGVDGPISTVIVRDITERSRLADERERVLAQERESWAEAQRIQERTKHLQAIIDAAITHLSIDDLLGELLERLRGLLHADSASVLILDAEGRVLRMAASSGLVRDPEEIADVPLGVGIAGRIAAEARPVVVEDLRRVPSVSRFLRRRLRSLAGVPITYEGQVTGVLHVGTLAPRRFGEEDVALLEVVASRLGPAMENARLHAAEQEARLAAESDAERLRVSRSVAEALSDVLPLAYTADRILEHVVPALGGIAGAVGLLDDAGLRIDVVASMGYSAEARDRFGSIPLDAPLPISAAVRDGRPVLLGSVAERDEAFPSLEGNDDVGGSWAALPLLVNGRPAGVLAISFPDARAFDASDRGLMATLAYQCAQALDRSTVYERERRVRHEVDGARRRLALLQSLTARLSRALTADEIARILVAEASVALGAQTAIVVLLDEESGMLELAAADGYDEKALAGWDRFPVDVPTPIADAVRSAQPVLLSSDEMIERYPAVASSVTSSPKGPIAAVPVLVGDRSIGALGFTFPPEHDVGTPERELLSALGRHAGQALERARLYETERVARREAERARERTERLQAVTEALAEADSPAGVLEILVDHSLAALGATAAVAVELQEGDMLEVVAVRGYPTDLLEDWRRFPIQAEGALAKAARTRTSVWTPSADQTYPLPAVAEHLRRLGPTGAFAAIPLKVGDLVLGALAIQFPEPRTWEEDDRELLRAIARQCAQAWFRAQLHDAETASRRELRRSERRYRSLVQATSAVEWTVDPAGAFVEPQPSWETYTGQTWQEHQGFGWLNAIHPDDRAAIRALWVAARDARVVYEAECLMWHAPSSDYHHVVARAAPVRDDGGRVVEWVGTVADVHQARLAEAASIEREQESRAHLQLAGERLSFLAEASGVLASSLFVDETLQRLSDLVVPRLADWCVIDMLDGAGDIQLVAASHVDAAKVELAKDLRRRYPPDPDSPIGAPHVLRTGRSQLVAQIPPEILERAAKVAPEIEELVRDLQLRSVMAVPLTVADRTFGAITFVWADSGRTYTEEDLALAEDLAGRASIAIENARLYELEKEARKEEAEARRRLHILAEAGAATAASLEPRVIVSALTRLLARELADWSAAILVDGDRVVDAIGAHRDPRLTPLVGRALTAAWPYPGRPHALIAKVLKTGVPATANDVPDAQLRRIVPEPEQLESVRALGFSSVAVVPLSGRGRTLGVLGAIRAPSSEPFDADDVDLLVELGRRTALALDNARLYAEREYVADTLQRSLLPPDLPRIPWLEMGAAYLPASGETSVGGDFYDVFEADLDHWVAVIGDVVGKGPAAAAMMGLARYTIRTAAMSESRPSRILAMLNDAILRQTTEQRFCTACCLRILRRSGTTRVTLANGGHPLPIVLRRDGTLETAGEPGTLLGVFEDPTLVDRVIDLQPGDALVLYTDGVTDERRGDEEFGEQRLLDRLTTLKGRTAQEIADEILGAVVRFRSDHARDDIAILALRVAP